VKKLNLSKRMLPILFWLTIAQCALAQTFTTLVTFDGTNGFTPSTSLVQGIDGNYYGTTEEGGTGSCKIGCGTIFRITSTGSLSTLYNFCESPNCLDGSYPIAGLILGFDGNFYGVTTTGGTYNSGTIFKFSQSGALTTIYSFCALDRCADGNWPEGPLLEASDGALYGVTAFGGNLRCSGGCGTIFRINPDGSFATLYTFCSQSGCPDGAAPVGALVQATNGNFYGTTTNGGMYTCSGNLYSQTCGTIFQITSKGELTTLHNFRSIEGYYPYAGLTQGMNGNFYGTTYQGGRGICNDYGCGVGTIFGITRGGVFHTLYIFGKNDDTSDGAYPSGNLILANDGDLYGTTQSGGADTCQAGCGTIFSLSRSGLTTLHDFDGTDENPDGALFQATTGIFYGTTPGTVFSFDLGLQPFVTLIRDAAKANEMDGILGQGLTGTTNVSFNGTSASFKVVSDTLLKVQIPGGVTTGYVTVTTPTGSLTSNIPFYVIP